MDKDEFSERILAMEGSLYGVARTYLKTPHDCADAVQEAVLKAWKARRQLRSPDLFKTWVTRILINECKTMLRKGTRTVLIAEVDDTLLAPDNEGDSLALEALGALDLKYRAAFVLHYIEGYSTKEIAEILRVPKGTVVSRLHRARQILKDHYDEAEACFR